MDERIFFPPMPMSLGSSMISWLSSESCSSFKSMSAKCTVINGRIPIQLFNCYTNLCEMRGYPDNVRSVRAM